jgi:hypothetical protein
MKAMSLTIKKVRCGVAISAAFWSVTSDWAFAARQSTSKLGSAAPFAALRSYGRYADEAGI